MKTFVADVPGLDATLPDIRLKLGGVEYQLCFDYNAVVLAEKFAGVNLLTAIVRDLDANKLRALLWAALVKENPSLTIEHVGSLITPRNMTTVHEALVAAWFGFIGTDEDAEADPKQAAQGQ